MARSSGGNHADEPTDSQRTTEPSDPRNGVLIRDPVHDYVVLPKELVPVVDHPSVQRLHEIRQTAMARALYPSLNGTRFEHSLGVMHLGRIAWRGIWSRMATATIGSLRDAIYDQIQKQVQATYLRGSALSVFDPTVPLDARTLDWVKDRASFDASFFHEVGLAIGAAGLVHDLGHPPFSHTLESLYERHFATLLSASDGSDFRDVDSLADEIDPDQAHFAFHELVGLRLTRSLGQHEVGEVSWWLVEVILRSSSVGTWSHALHQIIAAEVDVDRIDYLVRDARLAGIEFGAIDQTRLFESMEMHTSSSTTSSGGLSWRIGFGYRSRTAIETFLTNRIRYYQWVLFHHHVVAKNKFLEDAVEDLLWLSNDANGTTDADSELLQTLGRLKPDLDYLSHKPSTPISLAHGTTVSDSNAFARSAEVNDSSILSWLQRSAPVIRGALVPGSWSPSVTQTLRRFTLLYDAVVLRASNWFPAWKTEDHFLSVANLMNPGLVQLLDRLEREAELTLNSDEEVSEELTYEQMSRSVRKKAILAHFRTQAGIGDVQLVNAVAQRLFERADATSAKEMERRFVQYLRAHSHVDPFTNGAWISSFQSTTAVKDPSRGGVAIYRYADWDPIANLSASVASLNSSYGASPKLFVYYISSESSLAAEGGSNLKSSQVDQMRKIVVSSFVSFCEDNLEAAISSSITR